MRRSDRLTPPTTARADQASTQLAAAFIGLAVPSLVAGRVPIAVLLGVAGLTIAYAWRRRLSAAALLSALNRPMARSLVLMFGVWLLATVVTLDPPRSWAVWGQTAAFVAAGTLLMAVLRAEPDRLATSHRALIAGAIVTGIIAAISLYLWPPALDPLRTARIEFTSDAVAALRSYGSVAPCLAAIVLWAGWRLGGVWRVGAVVFLPIAAAIVYGTASHAGFLGLLAAGAALGIARLYAGLGRAGRRWLVIVVLAVAVAIAAVILSLLPVPPYDGSEALAIPYWLIDPHRQYIWGFAWHTGLESPWLGYGLDTAGRVPGAKAFLPGFGDTQTMPSHAHNWLLELFVESGALGAGAALAALGVFARVLLHRARRGDAAAYAAIALSGAYFGSGLVNFSVWAAWWQASFLVLLAMTLAAPASREKA